MRTMIWSRIYPASSNRILKHIGWSMRASSSTNLSETQAPVFVFHLLCSFHVHGWKALCIFQGMRRKRDMRQPSPGPLPAPSCQDSVTCLFLIARKLAPRSEKEKRRGLSEPFKAITTISMWKAVFGIDRNGTTLRVRWWTQPSSSLCLVLEASGCSPWSPIYCHCCTHKLESFKVRAWYIQGIVLQDVRAQYNPQHLPPANLRSGLCFSLSGPTQQCWCNNKILFLCKKWPCNERQPAL